MQGGGRACQRAASDTADWLLCEIGSHKFAPLAKWHTTAILWLVFPRERRGTHAELCALSRQKRWLTLPCCSEYPGMPGLCRRSVLTALVPPYPQWMSRWSHSNWSHQQVRGICICICIYICICICICMQGRTDLKDGVLLVNIYDITYTQ
jgi:hypothetical protein